MNVKVRSDIRELVVYWGSVPAIFLAMLAPAAHATSHRPIICIDPGHPSEIHDGMQLQNGTTETHCNWVVAERLKKLLADAGYRVVMTKRRENEFVKNVRRAEAANHSHAALMLRLHCDTGSGTGFR